jgi:Ion channel
MAVYFITGLLVGIVLSFTFVGSRRIRLFERRVGPFAAVGPSPQVPPKEYWKLVKADFWRNLRYAKRIFVWIFVYVLFSAAALHQSEYPRDYSLHSLGNALYSTWITMTTVGNANPVTWGGQLVTALDGLVGLLTFGVVVWLITTSLTQTAVRESYLSLDLDISPSGENKRLRITCVGTGRLEASDLEPSQVPSSQ